MSEFGLSLTRLDYCFGEAVAPGVRVAHRRGILPETLCLRCRKLVQLLAGTSGASLLAALRPTVCLAIDSSSGLAL